jgi:threonine synthase
LDIDYILVCPKCKSEYREEPNIYRCTKCNIQLEYRYSLENIEFYNVLDSTESIWRYRRLLPKINNVISLGEGFTPTYPIKRLKNSLRIRIKELYVKDDSRNPTGSFRDRAASIVSSRAVDWNYEAVICASNGNMGASLAAYVAKAGLTCYIYAPMYVDIGKLAQIIMYGGIIEQVGETLDEAVLRAIKAERNNWYQGTPELNPLSIEAQKTIAYELIEQIGVPDWIICPTGSGSIIYSIWKGFNEAYNMDLIKGKPRLIAVQADGCSPIVTAFLKSSEIVKVRNPQTIASGICIANPLYGVKALEALKDSRGIAVSVSDEDILRSQKNLSKLEGLFVEPAAASTIAALEKLSSQEVFERDETVLCFISGSGLKTIDLIGAYERGWGKFNIYTSTKVKILNVLNMRGMHGYEIWKNIGKIMKIQAVYQHLNELEKLGLIKSQIAGRRKIYSLTSKGEGLLKAVEEIKTLLNI